MTKETVDNRDIYYSFRIYRNITNQIIFLYNKGNDVISVTLVDISNHSAGINMIFQDASADAGYVFYIGANR
jgi:hypothetical protein